MQVPDIRTVSPAHTPTKVVEGPGPARRILASLALILMLVALWSMTHRYKSLSGDAELYAVQAMARIHPELAADLFLQNESQDRYTVFSPLYAWCIGFLGLRNAALTLAIMFKVCFFMAAWALVRILSDSRAAFTSVALLIITVGTYGAFGVFHYAEDWLTARSLAEALVAFALVLHFSGLRTFGLAVAALALFIHPLMALPGLLVLVFLWCSLRIAVVAAAAGVLSSLGIALWSVHEATSGHFLTIMDPEWYEVVRERSVFLFLQYWTPGDWSSNARPFLSLTFIAVAWQDDRVRKLCLVSMLVGSAGLAVAFMASVIGPVAIMVQGQAWRWEWITCFVSVLLLAPAAARIYRDTRCGPLCAVLLIAGWNFPPIDGTTCVAVALLLLLVRDRIDFRTAAYLRWAAMALAIIIAAWAALNSWSTAFAPAADSGRDILFVSRVRNILGLEVPAVLLVLFLCYWIDRVRSLKVLALMSLCLGCSAALVMPWSLRDVRRDGAATEIAEFADWRKAIPPTSNVYVAPAHNSATFAWFTLQRPSYLSVDQSAGVVFSRAVAMEVKRRSRVLLPLVDPDWRLLTGNGSAAASGSSNHPPSRSLTRENLMSVCGDPLLDFIVAKETVAIDHLRHDHRGDWKDWNLYDCRHVRSLIPTA